MKKSFAKIKIMDIKKCIKINLLLFFMLLIMVLFYCNCKPFIIDNTRFMLNRYYEKTEYNTVNIVFISDVNYVDHMNTAIYSLVKNKAKDSKYHIFVIGANLRDVDIQNIKKLEKVKDNVEITTLNNKFNIYKILNVKSRNAHVNDTDLFKFAVPNILVNIDKALLLDCDTLVQTDLSELYNIDIKDDYIAGAESDRPVLKLQSNNIKYINNGVMLMNLSNMRKDNIPYKLVKERIYLGSSRFVTQDAFNDVLYPKIKLISYEYNCIPPAEETYPTSCKNAKIIHWASSLKPWRGNKKALYKDIYVKYEDEYMDIKNGSEINK